MPWGRRAAARLAHRHLPRFRFCPPSKSCAVTHTQHASQRPEARPRTETDTRYQPPGEPIARGAAHRSRVVGAGKDPPRSLPSLPRRSRTPLCALSALSLSLSRRTRHAPARPNAQSPALHTNLSLSLSSLSLYRGRGKREETGRARLEQAATRRRWRRHRMQAAPRSPLSRMLATTGKTTPAQRSNTHANTHGTSNTHAPTHIIGQSSCATRARGAAALTCGQLHGVRRPAAAPSSRPEQRAPVRASRARARAAPLNSPSPPPKTETARRHRATRVRRGQLTTQTTPPPPARSAPTSRCPPSPPRPPRAHPTNRACRRPRPRRPCRPRRGRATGAGGSSGPRRGRRRRRRRRRGRGRGRRGRRCPHPRRPCRPCAPRPRAACAAAGRIARRRARRRRAAALAPLARLRPRPRALARHLHADLAAALVVTQVDTILGGLGESSRGAIRLLKGDVAEAARATAVVRDEGVDHLAVRLERLPEHLRERNGHTDRQRER